MADESTPRRWRKRIDKHPCCDRNYIEGVYFPQTDLNVTEMGLRGTGIPYNVEWLDEPTDFMKRYLRMNERKSGNAAPGMERSRRINTHKIDKCNEAITVETIGQPDVGGAPVVYSVRCSNGSDGSYGIIVKFQNGGIETSGVNGITNEVLLAIIQDRLDCYQAGPFKCDENAVALHHIHEALQALEERTRQRKARGVEGTHTP